MRGVLFAVLLGGGVAFAEVEGDLLQRWFELQRGVETVQGEFVQTRKLPALKIPLRSEGRMWMRRDGFFRWESGKPVKVVVIGTPGGVEIFEVERGQRRLAREGDAGDFSLRGFPAFLGRGEFEKEFEILKVWESGGLVRVAVRPRGGKAREFLRSAEWGFDAASGRVDFFEFAAKDGSVFRMDFRNVELNGALPDGLFRFED